MAESRSRARRSSIVFALVVPTMLIGLGVRPALAEVSVIRGSAYGYHGNVSLSGGSPDTRRPAPTLTLPSTGSATPMTATEPSGRAQYGPAVLFESGRLDVSSRGTSGPNATVTSSSSIMSIGQGPFGAGAVKSSCNAGATGVSGSTTIEGGMLETFHDSSGDSVRTEEVPVKPRPNQTREGFLDIGDRFRVIFNEQVTNSDGSLTVNAVHLVLLGPTVVGDLFIGQAVCGVTATADPTTETDGPTSGTRAAQAPNSGSAQAPTSEALRASGTTSAQVAASGVAQDPTMRAAQATTTTSPIRELSGGAFGYFTSVAIFGGAPAPRGPTPSVTLPTEGANPPLTASEPSGRAAYGPAELFTSGRLEVSTQGTTGPSGSTTSSSSMVDVGPGPFTARNLRSTCTASGAGQTASVSLTDGRITLSAGANPDDAADDTVVQLPANPAPNTPYEGKIEAVGDSFRIVINEQQTSPSAITVNAVHMDLLGPTAVGELVIGQSRCATTATTFPGAPGAAARLASVAGTTASRSGARRCGATGSG